MYFSPSSQKNVTTCRRSGYRARSSRAATRCAPELGPTNSPNSRARRRISLIAASLSTATISSMRCRCLAKMPGDEAVGDALDQVPADLAAHQDARFVRLDGDHPARPVPLAEALTHADDGAPGAHSADHRVRDRAIRQLGERLRAEPGAVLLNLPLRI